MKKSFLFLVMTFASVLSTSAVPRTFSQARSIAERQAAHLGITIDAKAMAKAKSINHAENTTLADYFVFPYGNNQGYTIVSGDDLMPEIVGYSDHGTIDVNNMPASMAAFLNDYTYMVHAVQKGDKAALKLLAERKALKENTSTRTTKKVEPMLDGVALWDQSEPYNLMCPKYNGTDIAATGCVATAMAQVMAYWKYPKELKNSIPAYTTKRYRLSIDGATAGEKYDWDNMLPQYASGKYSTKEANAVAKLMSHCGAAVEMDYGPESAANVYAAHMAYYFGYDTDFMMDVKRYQFTLAEWTAIIDRELQEGRPILYSGSSSSGGHQYVCDGSDADGLYHINWGWGGYQNGYFDLTILNPIKGGTGSGNAGDGYNRYNKMIIGIQPDNGKIDEPLAEVPILGAYYESYMGNETGIEITQGTRKTNTSKFKLTMNMWFGNDTYDDVNAMVGFGIKTGNKYTLISTTEDISIESGYLYFKSLEINYAFLEGTYPIYALYSIDGGKTWKKCGYSNMHPYIVNVTAKTLTEQATQLTATLSADGNFYDTAMGTLKLSVTNNGNDEYLGLINLYTSSSTTMPDDATTDTYMTIPAHTTVTQNIEIQPTDVGKFYAWVLNDTGVTLVDAQQFTTEKGTEPSFTLVDVKTNATPGAYEHENAYISSSKVVMPRIDDDYAEFTYVIRNDGTPFSATCMLLWNDTQASHYWGYYKNVNFKGNGETTTISYKVTPEDAEGGRCLMGEFYILKDFETSETYDIATDLPKVKYAFADNEDQYYEIDASLPLVYIAGNPNSVSSIRSNESLSVYGGKGEIVINLNHAQTVPVYSIDGRHVCDINAAQGTTTTSIKPGLYICNGKKIVVR